MTTIQTTDKHQGQTALAAATTGDKLVGRVALVTGGTRGIGAAICTSLASQGAEIAAGFSGNTTQAESSPPTLDNSSVHPRQCTGGMSAPPTTADASSQRSSNNMAGWTF